VALAVAFGGGFGLVAGYAGGLADNVMMRLVDLWVSVPPMLLALIVATALKASLSHTILAVGLVMIPRYARIMRAQVLAVRARPFVAASRAIGTREISIMLRHVLPHTASPVLVMLVLGVADAILMGAALSFIGIGVIDDRPDWGFLLSQGRNYVAAAWWFPTFPGLAISLLVVAINSIGQALRRRLQGGP
jgi:peptide/nickel transport system permease protein